MWQVPGYSTELKASSIEDYTFPEGKAWQQLAQEGKGQTVRTGVTRDKKKLFCQCVNFVEHNSDYNLCRVVFKPEKYSNRFSCRVAVSASRL